MNDYALQPTDGLVIMAIRIRDEERRQLAFSRLNDLPSERPTPTIFEFSTADWDEGMWEEEIEWFTDLLEGTHDKVIVWRFKGKEYSRFTIGEGD
jgi:hypothetical protein